MTGTDLRYARRQLGATPEQLATLAGVEAKDIEEWEAVRNIPRKHRHAVDAALWQLEGDAAIKKIGLAECEWMTHQEAAGMQTNLNGVIRHLETCPTCKARMDYLRSHVRPEPIGGSPTMRAFGMFARLTGWKQSAFGGVMMILLMGGIGIPVLLVMGMVRRDPTFLVAALAFFVVLVVSGAAGGIVHYWTAPLREKGTAGYYASWILTVYGYVVTGLALLSLAPVLFNAGVNADDLPSLSDPVTWISFSIVSVLFGIVAGRSMRDTGQALPGPERKRLFSARNVIVGLGLLLFITANLLTRLARPSAAEEWEAVLPQRQAAAQANPQDPEAQRELAWALVALERWNDAEPVLQGAVRLNPQDADLHNSLGWARMQKGQFDAAVPLFKRAIHLDPEHPYAHQNLGWALYNLGRFEEAEPRYRKALEQNPQEASAHGGLGWVLHALRRLKEAEAEFQEAIRLEPANAWHHQGLAVAVMQNGRLKEALPPFREATRLAPETAIFWSDLGHAAHIAGEYAESAAAFEKAAQLDAAFMNENPLRRAMWEASRQGREYVPEP